MSVSRTSSVRSYDHFEPQLDSDPQAQRRLRGLLEQIDYAAFAANRDVIGQGLGQADLKKFQRLALAVAQARALWVGKALAVSGGQPGPQEVQQLAQLRQAYEELAEAYEGMRRMVERGYLPMPPA